MSEQCEIRVVPPNVRKLKAAVALMGTLGLSGWALWLVASEDQIGWSTLGLVPFLFLGL